MKTALVAGSTGLIGKEVLKLLLESDQYDHVKAISRRPFDLDHPKLQIILSNFSDLESQEEKLRADDIFCCLGTTIKKAGTQEKFRQVDYHYPLKLAEIGKSLGARQYLLVSALGASSKSSVFYNRVKGELEEALEKVGFPSLHIFRPSLLLGNREEERPAEDAAKIAYKVLGFLIPKKYKGIDHRKVARAMVQSASKEQTGVFIHESKEMQQY